jgi:anti-sigma-K factor RskA
LNYKRNPELQERLAAEYALGTLRGRARERLRRWMRDDAELERAVARWESRLAPMAETVRPVAPPARVWRGIEQRITPRGRASLWKTLGLMASGAVAALIAVAVLFPLERSTPSYVAVLSDPKTQKPVLLVTAARTSAELQIKRLDPGIQVSDRDLELWALPAGGKPKSLGVVPAGERSLIRLAALADKTLSDVPTLAISLEPKGGSTTGAPTGPVLYSGPCVKQW